MSWGPPCHAVGDFFDPSAPGAGFFVDAPKANYAGRTLSGTLHTPSADKIGGGRTGLTGASVMTCREKEPGVNPFEGIEDYPTAKSISEAETLVPLNDEQWDSEVGYVVSANADGRYHTIAFFKDNGA